MSARPALSCQQNSPVPRRGHDRSPSRIGNGVAMVFSFSILPLRPLPVHPASSFSPSRRLVARGDDCAVIEGDGPHYEAAGIRFPILTSTLYWFSVNGTNGFAR